MEATIQWESGTTGHAAKDFSKSRNPNGPWSYGFFKPGPAPDAATFTAYTEHGQDSLFGSISNPGSPGSQDLLTDMHNYPRVPHTGSVIHDLRTVSSPTPIFLSGYGIGSAVPLPVSGSMPLPLPSSSPDTGLAAPWTCGGSRASSSA